MRILNRVITITTKGVQYEADPRHAELMVRNLSLDDSKGVETPGAKPVDLSLAATKGRATKPWDHTHNGWMVMRLKTHTIKLRHVCRHCHFHMKTYN